MPLAIRMPNGSASSTIAMVMPTFLTASAEQPAERRATVRETGVARSLSK